MASHGAAPPAAGGSGLKITFKRTLPNPSPIPSTSAALPPAPLDHSSRSAASSTAPSARSGSRETPQSVKIRIPSATVDSAAQIELTRKYEALKTKYRTLEESREESAISLLRAQKLITHLRNEKSTLLDRIIALESAAGIISTEVLAAQDTSHVSQQQRDDPLRFPPPLPSTEDRILPTPTLYTSTDLSAPSYNEPVGAAPLPASLPPTQRSHHLNAVSAAENPREARIVEASPPPPAPVPVVVAPVVEDSIMYEVEPVARVVQEAPSKRQRTSYQEEAYAAPVQQPVALVPEPVIVASVPVVSAPETKPSSKGFSIKLTSKRTIKPASPPAEPVAAVLNALPNPFGFVPAPAPVIAPVPQSYLPALPPHPRAAEQMVDASMEDDHSQEESFANDDDYAAAEDSSAYGSVPPPSLKQKKSATPTASTASTEKPAKAKRPKNAAVVSGTHLVPFTPKNPDGSPRLPLPVSTMVLRNLGVVDSRPGYHTDRYIYPIGYECMRRYPSMIDPRETVEYISRIVDGGDSPRFQIEVQDQPGVFISGNTATAPWSQIVRAANKIRQRNHSNSVSGPDSYGLSQTPIKKLIQELPGVDRLDRYVWQNFIEEADPNIALEEARLQRLAIRKGQKKRRESEMGGEYNASYPPAQSIQQAPQYPSRPPSPKNPYALPFAPVPEVVHSALPPLAVDPYAPIIFNPYAVAALPPLAADSALPPPPTNFEAPFDPYAPGVIPGGPIYDPTFGQPFGGGLPPMAGARATDLYPGFDAGSASPFEHGGME